MAVPYSSLDMPAFSADRAPSNLKLTVAVAAVFGCAGALLGTSATPTRQGLWAAPVAHNPSALNTQVRTAISRSVPIGAAQSFQGQKLHAVSPRAATGDDHYAPLEARDMGNHQSSPSLVRTVLLPVACIMAVISVAAKLGRKMSTGQDEHMAMASFSSNRKPTYLGASAGTEVEKKGVDWAGGGFLSDAVNGLINSPLYIIMKRGARDTLINSAEKNGVRWRDEVKNWKEDSKTARAEAAYKELNDPTLEYPYYYTQAFHAYAEGNLGWLPAFECESATYSMALRVWKDEVKEGKLQSMEAQQRLRDGYLDAVKGYYERGDRAEPIRDILDVGCSVGMSTKYTAEKWPEANITGLDLSPHFLAVAKCRQEELGWGNGRVQWKHANAEATGLPDACMDFVSLSFVSHELPQAITRNLMAEAFRVLRPGGVFALTDNDPQSPVIQGLPPVLFTLMKSTEPWSDEYYTMDMEGTLRDVGYERVESRPCDPRHRAVTGTKPL